VDGPFQCNPSTYWALRPARKSSKMKEVRRSHHARMISGLLSALLVLIGQLALAFAPQNCSPSTCGQSCSMHVRELQSDAKVAETRKGCCKDKSTKPKKSAPKQACKCQFRSAPDAAGADVKLFAIPTFVVLDLPVLRALEQSKPLQMKVVAVSSFSDRAPPSVAKRPDSGRAPPAF